MEVKIHEYNTGTIYYPLNFRKNVRGRNCCTLYKRLFPKVIVIEDFYYDFLPPSWKIKIKIVKFKIYEI